MRPWCSTARARTALWLLCVVAGVITVSLFIILSRGGSSTATINKELSVRIENKSPTLNSVRNTESHDAEQKQPLLDATTDSNEKCVPQFNNQSYVVTLHLFEQLMASAYNFVQAQCWAKSLHAEFPISTVEPNIIYNRSILGFNFGNRSLPLAGEVFDMKSWYSQWPKNGAPLAPMVTRNEFLSDIKHFSKNVILVQFDFKTETSTAECKFTWDISSLLKDLQQYPLLTVSRKVCLYGFAPTPAKQAESLIIGDVGIQNTLIIFREWRGLQKGNNKIRIVHPKCSVNSAPYSQLKPSSTVVADAEKYANKYLGGFEQYVSVAARFELVAWDYWRLSMERRRSAIAAAIKVALSKVNGFKNKESVKNVYLSYDYGQLGSQTFRHLQFYKSDDLLVKFQEDLYDGKMSYREYNESMTTFKYQNQGYIAMVQMTLASRGRCLFRIGWGHCTGFVSSLFKLYHTSPYCIDCGAPYDVCPVGFI